MDRSVGVLVSRGNTRIGAAVVSFAVVCSVVVRTDAFDCDVEDVY